jgi:hypothetical protein
MAPTNFGSSASRPPPRAFSSPSAPSYSTPRPSYTAPTYNPPSDVKAGLGSPTFYYQPGTEAYTPLSYPGYSTSSASVVDQSKVLGTAYELPTESPLDDDKDGGWTDMFKDADMYVGFAGIFATIMAANKNLKEQKREGEKDRQHREQLLLQQQAHDLAMLENKQEHEKDMRGDAIDTSGATDVMRQSDSFA